MARMPFSSAYPFLGMIISYRYINVFNVLWGVAQWFSQLSRPGLESMSSGQELDGIYH